MCEVVRTGAHTLQSAVLEQESTHFSLVCEDRREHTLQSGLLGRALLILGSESTWFCFAWHHVMPLSSVSHVPLPPTPVPSQGDLRGSWAHLRAFIVRGGKGWFQGNRSLVESETRALCWQEGQDPTGKLSVEDEVDVGLEKALARLNAFGKFPPCLAYQTLRNPWPLLSSQFIFTGEKFVTSEPIWRGYPD